MILITITLILIASSTAYEVILITINLILIALSNIKYALSDDNYNSSDTTK